MEYFKKTPISEPPKEAGMYHTFVDAGRYMETVSLSYFNGSEWVQNKVTHYLVPCSPPDEGRLLSGVALRGGI